MDQQKIGAFLKQLRKEKNLTQEELAEKFYVSPKTISRWETGSNMPDLSILIELSEFYEVDIRNLIDGERKIESVDNNTLEAIKKAIEYEEKEKAKKEIKWVNFMSIAIMSAIFFCVIPLMLFHGPSEGGYLYGKVPHSVLSVCVWITSILTSILLSVCLFALLQKMQQDYVKKEDVKKYTIINLLIIVPIAICLVLSELYDPLYGFLTDSHLKNIVTILFISYLTIFIVFYAISIHKSIKAWKAQKEEESKQSQE